MFKKIGTILLGGSIIFGLSACDDEISDEDIDLYDVSSDKVEDEENNEEADEAIPYNSSWSDEWKGLKHEIDQVMVYKEPKIDEDTEYEAAIVIHFVVKNESKKDFSTFPDQATLATNTGKQIDADTFSSEDIGGELMSGAEKSGHVLFPVEKLDDVENIEWIRLKWDAFEEEGSEDYLEVDTKEIKLNKM